MIIPYKKASYRGRTIVGLTLKDTYWVTLSSLVEVLGVSEAKAREVCKNHLEVIRGNRDILMVSLAGVYTLIENSPHNSAMLQHFKRWFEAWFLPELVNTSTVKRVSPGVSSKTFPSLPGSPSINDRLTKLEATVRDLLSRTSGLEYIARQVPNKSVF